MLEPRQNRTANRLTRAGGAAGLLSIALAATATGCATKNLERQRPAYAGDAGMGWQLVMPSGPALASLDEGALEMARLNAAFGVQPLLGTATHLYPTGAPPSLTNTRRIYLDDEPDRQLFFLPLGVRPYDAPRRYRSYRSYRSWYWHGTR